MVRTKTDRVPGKVSGGKSAVKAGKSTPIKISTGGTKVKSQSSGNRYHPRDTPEWQKPITCFLNQSSNNEVDGSGPSSSGGAADIPQDGNESE